MKAKMTTQTLYDFEINGVQLKGFTKGESFHGMTEYWIEWNKHKQYLIIDMDNQDPLKHLFLDFFMDTAEERSGTVLKISPDL